jgi:hypothetical protein
MQTAAILMEATAGWSFFYSLALVLVGFMFLLNFVLAVLTDNYMERHEEELVR